MDYIIKEIRSSFEIGKRVEIMIYDIFSNILFYINRHKF